MHYLIDGHNLIAKMPDISLSEGQDEFELTLRLKGWASASRKRRVTVIFDGGLPGGTARLLSNRDVTVVFASYGQTADALIIGRIHQVKNPREYTLVSSDRQIMDTARSRRMPQIRSEIFAAKLNRQKQSVAAATAAETAEKPAAISEAEVDEWLALFGPVPERPLTPPVPKRPSPPPPTPEKSAVGPSLPPPPQPLTTAKTGERALSEEEVADWLTLFATTPSPPVPSSPSNKAAKVPASSRRRKQKSPPAVPRAVKADDVSLSEDEVDAWLHLFKNKDSKR